ncbi:hypothetical protein [Massilia glaciei]|uniref:hypothetical protein n=1 Tax=Massilia glaciei TaxID=1524097 RepID=UPI001E40C3D7|nr:hypothetical protein [Massilia glaciei]
MKELTPQEAADAAAKAAAALTAAAPAPAAAEPAGADSPHGLSNAAEIEALADQLGECADEIHARILRQIRENNGPLSESEQNAARALFDEELLLRQRADGLYADAAISVVSELGQQQKHIMALTANAAETIRKIGHIGHLVGLAGSLVTLGGAVMTHQVMLIVPALDKVRKQIALVDATAKKP